MSPDFKKNFSLYFSNTAQHFCCTVFEKVICFIIVALTLKNI